MAGVDGAFLVQGLLSAEEAAALVEVAEGVGFTGLEGEFEPKERNNTRVMTLDEQLAGLLYDRLIGIAPTPRP